MKTEYFDKEPVSKGINPALRTLYNDHLSVFHQSPGYLKWFAHNSCYDRWLCTTWHQYGRCVYSLQLSSYNRRESKNLPKLFLWKKNKNVLHCTQVRKTNPKSKRQKENKLFCNVQTKLINTSLCSKKLFWHHKIGTHLLVMSVRWLCLNWV